MKALLSLAKWFLALFNPPPRDSLSFAQKIGRVFLMTLALFGLCLVSALATAVTLFVVQRIEAGRVGAVPLVKALAILFDSMVLNVVCVFALLQIKRLDENLIPRRRTPTGPKL
jgi:hypothetical protein